MYPLRNQKNKNKIKSGKKGKTTKTPLEYPYLFLGIVACTLLGFLASWLLGFLAKMKRRRRDTSFLFGRKKQLYQERDTL